jgi:DNA-binding CsgD family transcriptional regulator
VLAQYAAGNRTREVADNLGLSERTVLAHAAGATRKLGAKTRLHAIALAVHRRIVDVGG